MGNQYPSMDSKKSQKRLSKKAKYVERLAFSKYASSKKMPAESSWRCCDVEFENQRDIHKHIALKHASDIGVMKEAILENGDKDARWSVIRGQREKAEEDNEEGEAFAKPVADNVQFPWLPLKTCEAKLTEAIPGKVLLFYKYRPIENTEHVKTWQEELCKRLNLTGKIRVGKEGLNATVGGSSFATKLYVDAVIAHPLFSDMTHDDFKESEGSSESFGGGLKVGVFEEIVPMGVDPSEVTSLHAGQHLEPEEFHRAIEEHVENKDPNCVFVDCRNFYESKIGCFEGAVTPDIRKFSYWPEYVEKNRDFFKDKSVYMYCTGGIRCERGSAYFRQKNVCQNVYQLKGGIHKYIEKYPDGYFRGKLFVFDDRFAIKANDDIISKCVYCGNPWDQYQVCSSTHCYQLVLSCTACRDQEFTACCLTCKRNHHQLPGHSREECECTMRRERVPVEGNPTQANE